jgi:vacuolar protein sorting-associated protein 35
MISRHFRNTLAYIQRRKNAAYDENGTPVDTRWDDVDVVGALLKMGLVR